MTKALQLSREALGTRRFKYTAGVTREVDGSFGLVVAAAGLQGEHRMPEPTCERRPFSGSSLDEIAAQVGAFLEDWLAARPDCRNQVLCCTKAVDNALARARAKLASEGQPLPPVRRR